MVNITGMVKQDNKCEIIFLNAKNLGDYVYANLDKTLLKTIGKFPKELRQEMNEFTKNLNKNKHSLLNVPKVKEYDMVELIVEDEKYSKSGISKLQAAALLTAIDTPKIALAPILDLFSVPSSSIMTSSISV